MWEAWLDSNAPCGSATAERCPSPGRLPDCQAWAPAHVCLSKPNTVTKEQTLHEAQSPSQSVILVKFMTGFKEDKRILQGAIF